MRYVLLALVSATLTAACSDPSSPERTAIPACDPISAGLPPAPHRFYLADIDSAGLPQSLTFGMGTFEIAAGQLALDYDLRSVLLAYYTDARAPRFGIAVIGGRSFVEQSDNTLALVGNDSTDVHALVTLASDSLSLQYESLDLADPGNDMRGAHVLEYLRCP